MFHVTGQRRACCCGAFARRTEAHTPSTSQTHSSAAHRTSTSEFTVRKFSFSSDFSSESVQQLLLFLLKISLFPSEGCHRNTMGGLRAGRGTQKREMMTGSKPPALMEHNFC